METCTRLLSRDNTVCVRWTPAHLGVEGNEMADRFSKGAAEDMLYSVDRAYLRQASFAHMTRVTTEAKTEGTSRWMASHIQRRRGYRPPKGGKLRKELQHERKALAGRHYQLHSGHAATGAYLCSRVRRIPSDRCWWCVCNLVFAIPLHAARRTMAAACRCPRGQQRFFPKKAHPVPNSLGVKPGHEGVC